MVVAVSMSDLHISCEYRQPPCCSRDKATLPGVSVKTGTSSFTLQVAKHYTTGLIFQGLKEPVISMIRALSLKAKESGQELIVIINGDTFNLNPKTNPNFPERETGFIPELVDLVNGFVKNLAELDIPVLLNQGNSDVDSYDNLSESHTVMRKLNQPGIKVIENKPQWDLKFSEFEGNFCLKTDSVMIIGLNSLPINLDIDEQKVYTIGNQQFVRECLKDNLCPVIIYTHHPPFYVFSEKAMQELGMTLKYMRKQEWLIPILEAHSKKRNVPIALIAGHLHTYFKQGNEDGLQQLCSPAAFSTHEGQVSLGLISTSTNNGGIGGNITVDRLFLN